MIRHAFRIFNDGAIVFPSYGSAGDIPPGSMARRYHSRFEIRADGVTVFPAYDTVGGATPTPSAGTMARRFHDRLRIYNSQFDNFIVFDAYGAQDTPTPTPTPTGQVGTPGGGGRRKRTLPEYYSRQFFGRQVQLPQDDIAHQVAEQVLEQADGVLEDLADSTNYDELLATVDQLARIVAAHIESRGVYDAIEGVRAAVLAKKDGEIRELMLAAEEEAEVTEIMELL